ncbi:MAG: hypothetical protein O7J95_10645 [Planctomycetota bacterium]|nr:hypothetical protein [Planctomycetota bacterium]
MTIRFLRPAHLGVLAAGFVALAADPAPAQSLGELRRENERLRSQEEDLLLELKAAGLKIEAQRAEIVRMRKLLADAGRLPRAEAGADAPTPPEPVTIDESKPDASPRALLRAVKNGYAEAVADLEIGEPGSSVRTAYLRRLQRWTSKINREYRRPIEWHVRIEGPVVSIGRSVVVHLRAVDPETRAELGDAFEALLARSRLSRLRLLERRGMLGDVLVLKGTLQPRISINEERLREGPFDNPRFVGPFVEFEFGVIATTLLPPREQKEKATGGEDRGARDDGEGDGETGDAGATDQVFISLPASAFSSRSPCSGVSVPSAM